MKRISAKNLKSSFFSGDVKYNFRTFPFEEPEQSNNLFGQKRVENLRWA